MEKWFGKCIRLLNTSEVLENHFRSESSYGTQARVAKCHIHSVASANKTMEEQQQQQRQNNEIDLHYVICERL